jgi:hypothetical protein
VRPCLSLLLGALAACSDPQAEPRPADPSLSTLDRLIAKGEGPRGGEGVAACVAGVDATGECLPSPGARRTLRLRLALDERYAQQWPDARERLGRTLACVNQLYRGSGIDFALAEILPWDPGAERHDLRALLARVRRELAPDLRSLAVGMTVWEERRIYARAGGEIGLSQAGACVLPSWPRIENDCLTLAHELGHLLGAEHVPGKSFIMSWSAQPYHLPVADPIARVVATYRFHPRNLESIRAHVRARFTARGLLLPDPCIRRMQAIDRCWGL